MNKGEHEPKTTITPKRKLNILKIDHSAECDAPLEHIKGEHELQTNTVPKKRLSILKTDRSTEEPTQVTRSARKRFSLIDTSNKPHSENPSPSYPLSKSLFFPNVINIKADTGGSTNTDAVQTIGSNNLLSPPRYPKLESDNLSTRTEPPKRRSILKNGNRTSGDNAMDAHLSAIQSAVQSVNSKKNSPAKGKVTFAESDVNSSREDDSDDEGPNIKWKSITLDEPTTIKPIKSIKGSKTAKEKTI